MDRFAPNAVNRWFFQKRASIAGGAAFARPTDYWKNYMTKIPRDKILSSQKLGSISRLLKRGNKSIVFTYGTWDMLNIGQVRFIRKAKALGNTLVVGVESNATVYENKNIEAVLDENIREEMLLHLKYVDYVISIDNNGIESVLSRLRPSFVAVSQEKFDKNPELTKFSLIKSGRIKIKLISRQAPHISTTEIMRKVTSSRLGHVFKRFMKLRKKPLGDHG